MTRQQAEILRRTGCVKIADNGTGFMAYVTQNGGRSREADDLDDQIDPDDRGRRPAALSASVRPREETDAEREERFATNRRINAQIKAESDKREASRIASIDRVLALAQCPEVINRLLFVRNRGFPLSAVWDKVLKLELEFRNQLDLVQEYRRASLGLKSETNASRASRFLNDPDPDVRLYARMISNRELLPGEKADQEEAEPTKKKGKRGDRSGDKDDFEAAEAGEVAEPGQTGSNDPDADIDEYVRSRGWTK